MPSSSPGQGRRIPPRRRQSGASVLLLIVVSVFAVVAITEALRAFSARSRSTSMSQKTENAFDAAKAALVAYVAANHRLPCPGKGAEGTGMPDPDGPIQSCTTPIGVLPWKALGLREDQTFDGWGRRLSYRPYDGLKGLTQAGGADMSACSSALPPPEIPTPRLCTLDHSIPPADFIAYKEGLVARASATESISRLAFVVISHGENGAGAWTASNEQIAMSSSSDEARNASPGTTYVAYPRTDPASGLGAGDYFDDRVAWMTISEIVTYAGLASRAWPPP